MLDFRSGGWVLALAGVLCAAVLIWQLVAVLRHPGSRSIGDGVHVESYGFDLSNLAAARERLIAAGFSKDGLVALTDPPTWTIDEVSQHRRDERVKYLVPTDRVVALRVGDEARAYPVDVLAWHQVVNDTLGGEPIVVTYDPLCDAAVVFSRRAADGAVFEFGVSGLLLNSNLVFYDRKPTPADESLWSQLLFRAISGPAAGDSLRLLPFELTSWEDWAARHPQTTVLAHQAQFAQLYKRTYASYWGSDALRFPVSPMPPAGRPLKSPCLALRAPGGAWSVVFLSDLAERGAGPIETKVGDKPITLCYVTNPGTARVATPPDQDARDAPERVYAFWFAWHAHHPE